MAFQHLDKPLPNDAGSAQNPDRKFIAHKLRSTLDSTTAVIYEWYAKWDLLEDSTSAQTSQSAETAVTSAPLARRQSSVTTAPCSRRR
jgi:hypothetical protein